MARGSLLYLLLLLLALVSLAWNFIALFLHPLSSEAWGRCFGRWGIAMFYRAFWNVAGWVGMLKVDAGCLDALRNERGLIIVANHPSMLDALLLVARLPMSACIMKADLMKNVFLGAGARFARYIRNDSNCGLIRLAVDDLRRGGQLVVFPEGTRTVETPLNAFKPGVTLIAKLAKAPIQTVFIDTTSPYLGKNWSIWRLPPTPVVFSLRLGRRFEPAQDRDAQLIELEHYYRTHMTATPVAPSSLCPSPQQLPTSS